MARSNRIPCIVWPLLICTLDASDATQFTHAEIDETKKNGSLPLASYPSPLQRIYIRNLPQKNQCICYIQQNRNFLSRYTGSLELHFVFQICKALTAGSMKSTGNCVVESPSETAAPVLGTVNSNCICCTDWLERICNLDLDGVCFLSSAAFVKPAVVELIQCLADDAPFC